MKMFIVTAMLLFSSISTSYAGTAGMSIGAGENAVEATLRTSYFFNTDFYGHVGFLNLTEENDEETIINSVGAGHRLFGDNGGLFTDINAGLSIEGDAEEYGREKYGIVVGIGVGYQFSSQFHILLNHQNYGDVDTSTVNVGVLF
jgi:hypothetical protein